MTYFDNFGVEPVPKEIKNITGNRTITANLFRTEVYDSVICGYFCIGFIDFMSKGKSLSEYSD